MSATILFLLLPSPSTTAQTSPTQTFDWQEQGISLNYPAGWGDAAVITEEAAVIRASDADFDVMNPDGLTFFVVALEDKLQPMAAQSDVRSLSEWMLYRVNDRLEIPLGSVETILVQSLPYGTVATPRLTENDLNAQYAVIVGARSFAMLLLDPAGVATANDWFAVLDSLQVESAADIVPVSPVPDNDVIENFETVTAASAFTPYTVDTDAAWIDAYLQAPAGAVPLNFVLSDASGDEIFETGYLLESDPETGRLVMHFPTNGNPPYTVTALAPDDVPLSLTAAGHDYPMPVLDFASSGACGWHSSLNNIG